MVSHGWHNVSRFIFLNTLPACLYCSLPGSSAGSLNNLATSYGYASSAYQWFSSYLSIYQAVSMLYQARIYFPCLSPFHIRVEEPSQPPPPAAGWLQRPQP